MKKLIILIIGIFLYSCNSKQPNACSGCTTEHLIYNNSSDWVKLLHCQDTVYMIGPKGIIEKFPTKK